MRLYKIKIFSILLFFPFAGFSQLNDFQSWTSVSIGYSVNKKNEFNLEQSLRLHQNLNNWSTTFTELSYFHKMNKYFSFGLGYRYSFKNRSDFYLTAQRIYLSFKAKKKINDFILNYRLNLQTEYLGINHRENWQTPKSYNRHLFKIKYKISKKIKPYLAYELFIALGKQIYFTSKYRLTGGLYYSFNKKNHINIFYRYQNVHFYIPSNTYILGISYKYNL